MFNRTVQGAVQGTDERLADSFDALIDLDGEQLDELLKDYETQMDSVRIDIAKTYEKAQPLLLQIRKLKKKHSLLAQKFEATRAFIMVNGDGSLISKVDLKNIQEFCSDTEYDGGDGGEDEGEYDGEQYDSKDTVDLESIVDVPSAVPFKKTLPTKIPVPVKPPVKPVVKVPPTPIKPVVKPLVKPPVKPTEKKVILPLSMRKN